MATIESTSAETGTGTSLLFNPRGYDASEFDEPTRKALLATIEWFETRGKRTLKDDDHERVWYSDFLEFVKQNKVFASFLTPAADAQSDANKRWDTARICAFNEITGFYGLPYWYTWQVTILGLGPIWQSANAKARKRAADLLDEGAIFAFGLSEKEHGAAGFSPLGSPGRGAGGDFSPPDLFRPRAEGGQRFTATGEKYYIGNGNEAGMVSVFGRRADVEGAEGYVFFAADSSHTTYTL